MDEVDQNVAVSQASAKSIKNTLEETPTGAEPEEAIMWVEIGQLGAIRAPDKNVTGPVAPLPSKSSWWRTRALTLVSVPSST